MRPKFREDKATQAAYILIQKEGGIINYMKLIKLMYVADRKRVLARGRPITFDAYYSLDRGPILSKTLNLITEGSAPGVDSVWMQYISIPQSYMVQIKEGGCPLNVLSEAEIETLEQTYNELGDFNHWELVDWSHENLEEWQDPEGSAIPIKYHDILIRGGKTKMEAAEIENELEALGQADHYFSI